MRGTVCHLLPIAHQQLEFPLFSCSLQIRGLGFHFQLPDQGKVSHGCFHLDLLRGFHSLFSPAFLVTHCSAGDFHRSGSVLSQVCSLSHCSSQSPQTEAEDLVPAWLCCRLILRDVA